MTLGIESGAGQQLRAAAIEARVHTVTVELDFVQPIRPVRGLIDEAA
jgi:hypothetical protein